MSPVIDRIGLAGYTVHTHHIKQGLMHVHVHPQKTPTHCPYCGADRLRSKGRYERKVRHLECFNTASILHVHTHRYRCRCCSKTFIQQLPGIKPYRHSSEPFRQRVYQHHHEGACCKTTAKSKGIGSATVERIYQEHTRLKASERERLQCPQILGIDEHVLHRGGRYVTTFCDLKRHKVFDLAHGRSSAELDAFLSQLHGKQKVKIVCIDLSGPYRALIRKHFPNAKIVADRFHAVRLAMHHFLEQCRSLVPELKNQRGYLAALRKRPERLKPHQQERLHTLFNMYPQLRPLYEKMQQLCALLNHKAQNKPACKKHAAALLSIIAELKTYPGFEHLKTLANTLERWTEPIACMWRFSKNNAITEGFHRKMKLIQRIAYGFKSFENYRLRVIAQCG